MKNKEAWEERFDKEIIYPNGKSQGRYNCMSIDDENRIKSFISSLLEEKSKLRQKWTGGLKDYDNSLIEGVQ